MGTMMTLAEMVRTGTNRVEIIIAGIDRIGAGYPWDIGVRKIKAVETLIAAQDSGVHVYRQISSIST